MTVTEDVSDKRALGGCRSFGWHSAYRRADGALAVEWLEYQDPAPYDHATKIVFNEDQETRLGEALGTDRQGVISTLAERFTTYWAVRAFADAHAVDYQAEVDFLP